MTQPVLGTPWHKLLGIREQTCSSSQTIASLDAYWRCANYISAGQIYLFSNPLMKGGLSPRDIKHRLMGHWGTIPGLNFLYAHINRLIRDHGQNTVVLMGPGHGGPAGNAEAFIDDSLSAVYPDIPQNELGLERLCRAYSFPLGFPSNHGPHTPGSIHEGGELGYVLSHAYGAVLDNPSLLAIPIIGDGECETGPLAASWQTNKFINPQTDGLVLPIVHLNGYKISNPSILARISLQERDDYFKGMGYRPYTFVAGFDEEDALSIHKRFVALFEEIFAELCSIKEHAKQGFYERPAYPVLIFKTPKGWTCPTYIDGQKFEDSWRSHQVPFAAADETLTHFDDFCAWMASYRPQEIFEKDGTLSKQVTRILPQGDLRIGSNPCADAGRIRRALTLPSLDSCKMAVDTSQRGTLCASPTYVLGLYTAKLLQNNPQMFRVFGPDEIASNRFQSIYRATQKQWYVDKDKDLENDGELSQTGSVIEQLSEHQCEGLLEGYVLTGRHGIWVSYEAFAQITASMISQHIKWLEALRREVSWRKPISSLNILLTSHVWRQEHNGFTHQDPGIVDTLLNKSGHNEHVVHIYYPCDANLLLAVAQQAYTATDCVNVIFAGKQQIPVWLTLDEASLELAHGALEWTWASHTDAHGNFDLVLATCGDVPTIETLAAADILRRQGVHFKFVNVLNLCALQRHEENDDALTDEEFTELFSADKPVLFAFHAYVGTMYRLLWGRPYSSNFFVHGYQDLGSTTTFFDMLHMNQMDRFALAAHALQILDAQRASVHGCAKPLWETARQEILAHREKLYRFTLEHGYDDPAATSYPSVAQD
ncbi:phosphoketolase family protein [Fannyhessea vaginae]|uniref:phosphoketolase family protein n=1 Tax=Fannyhessea vaginae TaxID=82135 RepID=UPI0026F2DD94|nr:phosphoketolase family protein [Fannyhessea vaginae]